jgi:hypothetical protein
MEEFNFKDDEDEHNMEIWKFCHLPSEGTYYYLSTYSLLRINA